MKIAVFVVLAVTVIVLGFSEIPSSHVINSQPVVGVAVIVTLEFVGQRFCSAPVMIPPSVGYCVGREYSSNLEARRVCEGSVGPSLCL